MNADAAARLARFREPDGTFGKQHHKEPAVTLNVPAKRKGRRKSTAVVLGVTALLASAVLTGCGPSGNVIDADYAKVCQDKTTKQRIEDSKCSEEGRSSGHAGWYFFPMGTTGSTTSHSIPAVGQKLTGGTETIPAKATSKSGVSSKGSTSVSRGGFGSGAKGGSVGG
ncbi:tRNA-dihydrouridine synthase [Arthrobacter caoxuetaonis]|uniref:tRNA-dihydrouridine synthase n=1 Tax=Arthrobacter caoxuetaonis TaxID=2886935 RepID=A0A9X1SDZ7_9MICC|nr:tRNA-dihydrouridine synthase [Arthrobacter caoxuetaonis]MCC3299668.1 tRNA-dihydrouridine synthase [Arthrobacter caoxuetaonis]USQ58991.1 tRNA-dihydrouridine synthase [Arthrobacter caoxuetaonis]